MLIASTILVNCRTGVDKNRQGDRCDREREEILARGFSPGYRFVRMHNLICHGGIEMVGVPVNRVDARGGGTLTIVPASSVINANEVGVGC